MTILVAALVLALGCTDNEQRARAAGEAARAKVAAACASAGAAADVDAGADPEEGTDLRESCARTACEAPCREFAAAQSFHRACITACTANAECATDADCGAELRCIAIAPRVRRCRPTPTSHTPPATSRTPVPGSAP